jgi:hypothetical protein
MSVVSKDGGRWHAVPFEYGYGMSLVVDGGAEGNLVVTNSASYAPPTESYHRYANGRFVPAEPPGRAPQCGKRALEWAATSTQAIRFDQIGCEAGWALAVGEAAGLAGQTVGLFEWDPHERKWTTQTLDMGHRRADREPRPRAQRGGWFISVPQEQPGTVAFQLVGACCEGTDLNDYRSGRLITNAGGTWHVASSEPEIGQAERVRADLQPS